MQFMGVFISDVEIGAIYDAPEWDFSSQNGTVVEWGINFVFMTCNLKV